MKKEIQATLFISIAAFFLLCGYELLRSSANSLYQTSYGTQNLPLITSLIPIGVLLIVYIYGWLLSRFGPRYTLLITSFVSGLMMIGAYSAIIHQGLKMMTGILYVFKEAYIVLLVEQYWSFLNSTFGQDSAKKFNGPVAGMSSVGGFIGGLLLQHFVPSLGTHLMLLFSAGATFLAIVFSDLAYRHCGEPKPSAHEKEGRLGTLGFHSFKETPMLILLFSIVITTQIVSTVLMLSFQTTLQGAIPQLDAQTVFSGKFYSGLNLCSALLQFMVAPVALIFLPLGIIHLIIPTIHIGCALYLTLSPSLYSASIAYFVFKALDYSLFRATKETLYIPLSFDARYRAKEMIDVFGYRFSKGATSGIITLIQKGGVMVAPLYSWISVGAAALWFILIIPIIQHLPSRKRHSERSEESRY